MDVTARSAPRTGPCRKRGPDARGTPAALVRTANDRAFPALTLAALALSPSLAALNETLTLFAVPVLLLGLPHGALDIAVSRSTGMWRNALTLARFLACYVGLAPTAFLAWLALPVATFVALLVLSAWHFAGD